MKRLSIDEVWACRSKNACVSLVKTEFGKLGVGVCTRGCVHKRKHTDDIMHRLKKNGTWQSEVQLTDVMILNVNLCLCV